MRCLTDLFYSSCERSPDTARVRSKMIYASSKDRFKRELDGIQVELQATDASEVGLDVIQSRANWSWIKVNGDALILHLCYVYSVLVCRLMMNDWRTRRICYSFQELVWFSGKNCVMFVWSNKSNMNCTVFQFDFILFMDVPMFCIFFFICCVAICLCDSWKSWSLTRSHN